MTCFIRQYLPLNIAISIFASALYLVPLYAQAVDNKNNTDRRTIRVTTGIEEVKGWEQGLVKANPNLARWHWNPIYSYKQGYGTLVPHTTKTSLGRQGNPSGSPGKPAFRYNVPAQQDSRPKHIPMSGKALEEVQARYSQPVKTNLPSVQPAQEGNVYGQISNKQTQATLQQNQAKIISPQTDTYGQLYTTNEKRDTALKYSVQKSSVYGQLLNARKETRYNGVVHKQKGNNNK